MEYNNIMNQVEAAMERNLSRKRRSIRSKLKLLKTKKQKSIMSSTQIINHTFYKRVHNMTNIQFNVQEEQLLAKGLKHNTKFNQSKKDKEIALLNIENSITKTHKYHQDEIRTLFIDEMRKKTKQSKKKRNYKQDGSTQLTLKSIQKKLIDCNAIITKADKGNTIVVIHNSEYNTKIEEYIDNNNIRRMNNDPTKLYLKNINSIINKSTSILSKNQMYICKMIKPEAPNITGLPKIHKMNIPIRPLINFTTSPTYKIAKILNKWLTQHITLENDFSVKNNLELVDKIKSIHIPHSAKLASFDITNMYTNIPIKETLQITQNLLTKNNVEKNKIQEALSLLHTITQQNYFSYNNTIYTQTDGLPMGSPLSGTLANIYLNHIETEHIINNKNPLKKNIMYWYRYVDDILILFNGSNRQIDMLHQYINNIHNNIKFTLEMEADKRINFLDLTIQNINHKHSFKIYRKKTQTDHTIHNTSNHPFQHKIAAYNHMLNRLNHIPMTNANYTEELSLIKYIAKVNGYPETLINSINRRIKRKIHHVNMSTLHTDDENVKKYIATMYDSNTSNTMSKILNKYGYTIAHKTNRKLEQLLRQKHNNAMDSGIYKLLCNNCDKFYIGQTGRTFTQRFNEHVQELNGIQTKLNFRSNYAQHLYCNQHTYTDMQTNLKIIRRMRKGDMMDRVEEMEIYRERDSPLLLNDKLNTKTNKMYETILKMIKNDAAEYVTN